MDIYCTHLHLDSQRGYSTYSDDVRLSFTNCTGHVLHFDRSICILQYSGVISENI